MSGRDEKVPAAKKSTLFVNGVQLSFIEAERKFGIGESTIRARIRKLGWTAEEAVGLVPREHQNNKGIVFKGVLYPTQEEFVDAVKQVSRFSPVTLKMKLAQLNRLYPSGIDDQVLTSLVLGREKNTTQGGYLYLITCTSTGRQYIGISIRQPSERWKAHVSEAYFSSSVSPLKSAIRQFGESNFSLKILAQYDTNEGLKNAEKREISSRNTLYPNGLNGNKGGTLGALDIQGFEFRGKEYRSIRELADAHGIKSATLSQRVRSYGMTLEEAIDFERSSEVEFKGEKYETKKDLCDSLGVSYSRLIGLLHTGFDIEAALSRILNPAQCPICGSQFFQRSALNRYCAAACKEQARKMRMHEGASPAPNQKPVVYQGEHYPSVSEFARRLGLDRSRLTRELRRSSSVEQAVARCTVHYRGK